MTGVYIHEMLIPGPNGWIKAFSFFFDGESYDYAFEVASKDASQQDALDNARMMHATHRARKAFLRDVVFPSKEPN